MTTLLEKAFAAAARRPAGERELLASRLLAELAAEDDFDRAIAGPKDKLAQLAVEALAEHIVWYGIGSHAQYDQLLAQA